MMMTDNHEQFSQFHGIHEFDLKTNCRDLPLVKTDASAKDIVPGRKCNICTKMVAISLKETEELQCYFHSIEHRNPFGSILCITNIARNLEQDTIIISPLH